MSKALSRELRESCRYLRDGGWHQTAALMIAAANEIDRLGTRVTQLEGSSSPSRTVQGLVARIVARQKPRSSR